MALLYYQPFTEAAGIPLTETEIEAGYKHLHQLIRERAPRVLKISQKRILMVNGIQMPYLSSSRHFAQ